MSRAGKSDWQRRYDKSIKEEEEARNAEANENDSAGWHLLDALPFTGTGLDVLLLPIAVVIVGVAVFKRLTSRKT